MINQYEMLIGLILLQWDKVRNVGRDINYVKKKRFDKNAIAPREKITDQQRSINR